MIKSRPIRQNFQCTLETVTPLHIGCGEKLQKDMDFILESNQVHVFHRSRLFDEIKKMGGPGIAEFTNAIEEGSLGHWIKNKGLLKKIKGYSATVDNRPPRDITVQIRNGFGKPLIPGSSLKGSIRTAILSYLARQDKYRTSVKKAIIQYSKVPPRQLKFSDQTICRDLLGDTPNDNLMRGLTVGDVAFQLSDLALQKISIDRMVTKKEMKTKFPIFVESIKAGAKGTGQLSLDLYLPEVDRQKECFAFKMNIEEMEVLEAIRQAAMNTIELEVEFFSQLADYHSTKMGNFYNDLKKKQNELNEKQSLLQVGWGSGWRRMTGPLLTQEDLNQNNFALRKNLKLAPKHLDFAFPKSRKIISANGQNMAMGWVVLTLTPIEKKSPEASKTESAEETRAEAFERFCQSLPDSAGFPGRASEIIQDIELKEDTELKQLCIKATLEVVRGNLKKARKAKKAWATSLVELCKTVGIDI